MPTVDPGMSFEVCESWSSVVRVFLSKSEHCPRSASAVNQSERDVSLGDSGTSGLIWCDMDGWFRGSARTARWEGEGSTVLFVLRSLGQLLGARRATADLGRLGSEQGPAVGSQGRRHETSQPPSRQSSQQAGLRESLISLVARWKHRKIQLSSVSVIWRAETYKPRRGAVTGDVWRLVRAPTHTQCPRLLFQLHRYITCIAGTRLT